MTPTPTTAPTVPVAPPQPHAPTHPCVRCGRPVPLDVAMCEVCNPLGLADPATSQVHGTVFVAIVLAVVGLAVAAKLALSGVGPFSTHVSNVVPATSGLAVTLTIHNDGSKGGSTTCRISDASKGNYGPSAIVQTPKVEPGATRDFTTTVDEFGATPIPLAVECQTP